jgi:flagellar biosynthesis anti-sigma factor FlgM
MEVNGPSRVFQPAPVTRSQAAAPAAPVNQPKAIAPTDQVEISSVGKMLSSAQQSGEVRAERLAQIKAAIDAGTYETPGMLESALEGLFKDAGLDLNELR